MKRVIVGVDLSGPANAADTALAWFAEGQGSIDYVDSLSGATDADIVRVAVGLMRDSQVIVGLDAPLSYNDGGGDRPADKALRKVIVDAGMKSGSVMTPTFSKMAYLTLRGMAVARALELSAASRGAIVEVHPGAAFALNGGPIQAVLDFKTSPASRNQLLQWLPSMGLRGSPASMGLASHLTAACGAALAAWKWANGESTWIWKARPPHHPYDFSC